MEMFIIAFIGAVFLLVWAALWCCIVATNKQGTRGLGYFTNALRYGGLLLMLYAVVKSL